MSDDLKLKDRSLKEALELQAQNYLEQIDAKDKTITEQSGTIRKLTNAIVIYEEAVYKLACLGNNIRFGNSEGNVIAQRAIEKAKAALEGKE